MNASADEEKHDEEGKILVEWDGNDDPGNPRNMTLWKKWLIVWTSALAGLCVTCGSSIYTLTYDHLKEEFGSSREVSTLGLALYTLALGVGPLLIAPLSEFYGRKPILVVALIMFVIWNIPCAVGNNMATILIGRWFTGIAGSAFLSVSGGVVGDVFAPKDLALPMMIYTLATNLGPDIGPVLGGFIDQYYQWYDGPFFPSAAALPATKTALANQSRRWVFYVLMIWAGILVLISIYNPETYEPKLLQQRAHRLREETGDARHVAKLDLESRGIAETVIRSCYRPFELLAKEYMLDCLCMLTAVLLGVQYLLFGAFSYAYKDVYDFSPSGVGLTFLGIGVGAILGGLSLPVWLKIRNRQLKANDGRSEPEFRLPSAAFGAPLLPLSLFWFGWTCRSSIHWIVSVIATVPYGIGGLLIFNGVWAFLVEAYPLYAASAMGANAFTRLAFAGSFPLFGVQMYEKLGIGWASTLLGFIALACAPFPTLFIFYGKRIRASSQFAKPS